MVASPRSLVGLSGADVIGNISVGNQGVGIATLTGGEVVEDLALVQPYLNVAWRREDQAASEVDARLRPLSELGYGWNSYGARPIARNVLHAARGLLMQFVLQGIPFPAVTPTAQGGLTLEWTSPDREFAISLSGDRDVAITAFYSNVPANVEWELPVPTGDERVSSAIRELQPALATF